MAFRNDKEELCPYQRKVGSGSRYSDFRLERILIGVVDELETIDGKKHMRVQINAIVTSVSMLSLMNDT